jgi:hypothetical protein
MDGVGCREDGLPLSGDGRGDRVVNHGRGQQPEARGSVDTIDRAAYRRPVEERFTIERKRLSEE